VDVDDRPPALYCAIFSDAVYSNDVLATDASRRRSVELPTIGQGTERVPPPTVELVASMDDKDTVQWGAFHLNWGSLDRHVLVVAFRGSESPSASFDEFWSDWIRTDAKVLFPDTVTVPKPEPTDVLVHRGFNSAFT
jgi:hypothetical protein